jgi:hypothetical protein
MKFFALIMSFLMLALPVLPCADDSESFSSDNAKTTIAKQNNHEQEQEHNDNCSPFCHCSCCAGFSINHFATGSTSVILPGSKSYISHLQGDLIEHSSSIWQPPQLAV